MNKCSCGATFSCSCQFKIASDGSRRCNQCISFYEEKLKKQGKKDDQVLTTEQKLRIYGKSN